MGLLLAVFASALLAPPPEKLIGLMQADDYPIEALRNGWQGEVVVDLTVNVRGRVSACRVMKSSGYAVLDAATCRIFTTRAKFDPARDAQGNEIEGTVRNKINWRL